MSTIDSSFFTILLPGTRGMFAFLGDEIIGVALDPNNMMLANTGFGWNPIDRHAHSFGTDLEVAMCQAVMQSQGEMAADKIDAIVRDSFSFSRLAQNKSR